MRFVTIGMVLALSACGCKQKGGGGTGPNGDGGGTGTGTGSGGGSVVDTSGDPSACDAVATKVTGLYQANAERTKMTPDEVADNAAMVMGECRSAPNHVVACVNKVTSVVQLETLCLSKLDDDGSEGLQFSGK
ncbi:MAG TPA: hypothetical protein VM261_08095 [Kofleriaceae bacterium]|nr:hypothetical protein [Kofleriaceae bacterium]